MSIAELARGRHPESALTEEVAPLVIRASAVIQGMSAKAQGLLENPDADVAVAPAGEDDAVDRGRNEMAAMATLRPWPHGPRQAADTVLLARFYERYGGLLRQRGQAYRLPDHRVGPDTYSAQWEGDNAPGKGYWPEGS